jgi:hypothetical protein
MSLSISGLGGVLAGAPTSRLASSVSSFDHPISRRASPPTPVALPPGNFTNSPELTL